MSKVKLTYQGKPCTACGGTERYTSEGERCVECHRRTGNSNRLEAGTQAKYEATPQGKATKKRYLQTAESKAKERIRDAGRRATKKAQSK